MNDKERDARSDRVAKALLVLAVAGAVWVWGALSVVGQIFPYPQLRNAATSARDALSFLVEQSGMSLPLYYSAAVAATPRTITHRPERVAPGLILMSQMAADGQQVVQIIDNEANVLHEWPIDWFDLWPNPQHLDESVRPKSRPGTSVHGIEFLDGGDIVFNFENLGLIRLDYCGNVVWRLPYRTHHSIDVSASGNFWVGGKIVRRSSDPRYPNYATPFDEFIVLEVSPQGELLREISVPDLLAENGLRGLLYLSTINNYGTRVRGDTLHLNDIEEFPDDMEAGVFEPGDLMISLRNINAIVVFDPDTLAIKYLNVGSVLRQHDPDFVDGNTISVLDNNNLSPASDQAPLYRKGQSSRLVEIDARTSAVTVLYEGTPEHPFFTDIMGKHQWQPNGNILVNSARSGRSFEIDADGNLVWEYFNYVGEGLVGLIDDTHRLPPEVDATVLESYGLACRAP